MTTCTLLILSHPYIYSLNQIVIKSLKISSLYKLARKRGQRLEMDENTGEEGETVSSVDGGTGVSRTNLCGSE